MVKEDFSMVKVDKNDRLKGINIQSKEGAFIQCNWYQIKIKQKKRIILRKKGANACISQQNIF